MKSEEIRGVGGSFCALSQRSCLIGLHFNGRAFRPFARHHSCLDAFHIKLLIIFIRVRKKRVLCV